MSARVWVEGDPEPKDVVAVVDPDGVTWTLDRDDDDYDVEGWHQQLITKWPHPDGEEGKGAITGGSCFNDWDDIFANLPRGSELREATADEACLVTVRWAPKPMGWTA